MSRLPEPGALPCATPCWLSPPSATVTLWFRRGGAVQTSFVLPPCSRVYCCWRPAPPGRAASNTASARSVGLAHGTARPDSLLLHEPCCAGLRPVLSLICLLACLDILHRPLTNMSAPLGSTSNLRVLRWPRHWRSVLYQNFRDFSSRPITPHLISTPLPITVSVPASLPASVPRPSCDEAVTA